MTSRLKSSCYEITDSTTFYIYGHIAQENKYVHGKYQFEIGATEYLFGDNVKLRVRPYITSEVIELLPIASPVKILEQTGETYSFNGYDSPWYNVLANGKEGYVLGGAYCLGYSKHKW